MANKKLLSHCASCRLDLAAECFTKDAGRSNGLSAYCRDCRRARRQAEWAADPDGGKAKNRANYLRNRDAIRARQREYYNRNAGEILKSGRAAYLRRSFGITANEYDAMHDAQAGLCGICGQPERETDRRTGSLRKLAVDHDHETGMIRGLLCRRCNTALGLLGDSAAAVRNALEYLERQR